MSQNLTTIQHQIVPKIIYKSSVSVGPGNGLVLNRQSAIHNMNLGLTKIYNTI